MKLNTLKPTPLKPGASPTFAERIGRMLGRAWRGVLRRERNACAWLMAQGMNATFAQGILWTVRLTLLAVLLYGAFWVALLLGLAVLAVQSSGNVSTDDNEDEKEEWRRGLSGYGLYRGWIRIDPGDPDDDY